MAISLPLALAAAAVLGSAPRTLRVDYIHTGSAAEEGFALSGLSLEGPWPGNPARPLDDTNLGAYFFEVIDRATNRVLYSRGFASAFGEWQTTDEAKRLARGFHESLRFPEPAAPVQVVLKKRDAQGLLREAWSLELDPADPGVDRTPPAGKPWALLQNGPPAEKVDLLLLGDGYSAAEMEKWHADARRLVEMLFAVSPFKERRADFNVWALDTPSAESGVARPSEGVYRRSALGAAYDAFGSERYVLALDEARLREAAAAAPYDVLEIVVNGRTYGGGGIFNQYATVVSDNAFTPYVFVHEFAHHFAGLADEYYTSDVAYGSSSERPEPWEPNVSADPRSPKWKDLVSAGTPLPTPWPKAEFEALQQEIQARRRRIRAEHRPEAEMEALFREEQARVEALLSGGPHARAVGAFEGAMYEAKGYYRAEADCIMFTRHASFCAACRRAIERVIDLLSRQRP
jgi:IgA Peptidase M64/Peptidase M64 N-terminus